MTETDGGFFISPSDTSANFTGHAAPRKQVLAGESLKGMLASFGPLCRFEGTARTAVSHDDKDTQDETQVHLRAQIHSFDDD